jgi:signal transduction histidine kinase
MSRSRSRLFWKQILEVLTDVKASAHELHSPRLEYLGIAAVMRSFCEEFGKRRKVEIDFASHDLPGLASSDISLCLFRVPQEALYNAVKHRGVHRVEVQLWEELENVNFTVSDGGRVRARNDNERPRAWSDPNGGAGEVVERNVFNRIATQARHVNPRSNFPQVGKRCHVRGPLESTETSEPVTVSPKGV